MNVEDEIHFCKCKCGEKIKWKLSYKKYGWPKFINHHHTKLIKGKTIEERYGKTKSVKILKKREITNLKKSTRKNYNIVCKCGNKFILNLTLYLFQKNKYRKHCSRKCANSHIQTKEQNEARSKSFNINSIKEILNNVFQYERNVTKGKFFQNIFVRKDIGSYTFIRRKLKKENSTIDDIANQCDLQFKQIISRIGNNEIKVLNYHQKMSGLENEPFISQFPVGGKFLDRYYYKMKIAVEDNEPHHKYQQVQDRIRQKKVTDILGCIFINLDDREMMNKITNENIKTLEDFK